MRHRRLTADVFTDRIFGGNQLAVFPDGRGLRTEQMQKTAREFNFSEKDNAIAAIRVGGASVLVSEGTMEIP